MSRRLPRWQRTGRKPRWMRKRDAMWRRHGTLRQRVAVAFDVPWRMVAIGEEFDALRQRHRDVETALALAPLREEERRLYERLARGLQ